MFASARRVAPGAARRACFVYGRAGGASVQITGPTPRPAQQPAAVQAGEVSVDPELARRRASQEKLKKTLAELNKWGQEQKPGIFSGPNAIPVLAEPFTKRVGSAVSPTVDTGLDKPIRGKVESIIADKVFAAAGFVVEKVGFVAGQVLGPLSDSGTLASGEEAQIADQQTRERLERERVATLTMPPMWNADP